MAPFSVFHLNRYLVLALVPMLFLFPIQARALPPGEPKVKFILFDLKSFRVNALAGMQDIGNTVFTGQVSWNPAIYISKRLSLQANLGIKPLSDTSSSRFVAFEYTGLVAWTSPKFFIDIGGGYQTWLNSVGSFKVLNADLGYRFKKRLFKGVDNVFMGYSRGNASIGTIQELKLGLTISF